MNRGIHISISEPDKEDNMKTSLTMAESYDTILIDKYKSFFENLGEIYFNYKYFSGEIIGKLINIQLE